MATKRFSSVSLIQLVDDGKNDPIAKMKAMWQGAGSDGNILDAYVDLYMIGFRRQYRRRMSAARLRKEGFFPGSIATKLFDATDYFLQINGTLLSTHRKYPKLIKCVDDPLWFGGGKKKQLCSYRRAEFSDAQTIVSEMDTLYGLKYKPSTGTVTGGAGYTFHVDQSGGIGGGGPILVIHPTPITGTITNLAYVQTLPTVGVPSQEPKIIVGDMDDGSGTSKKVIVGTGAISGFKRIAKFGNGGNHTDGKPNKDGLSYAESIIRLEYKRSDGETSQIIDYEFFSKKNFYKNTHSEMTPIIKIKEDNVMNPALDDKTHREYRKFKKILRGLGLEGKDLVDSLEYACDDDAPKNGKPYPSFDKAGKKILDCATHKGPSFFADGTKQDNCGDCTKKKKKESDIDNAYIAIGVYPGGKSPGERAALWAFFDLFGSAHTSTTTNKISMSKLHVVYEFTMRKTTHAGVHKANIGPGATKDLRRGRFDSKVEEVAPSWSGGFENNTSLGPQGRGLLTLWFQKTENSYEKIEIRNFVQKITVITKGRSMENHGYLYYPDGTLDADSKKIDGADHSRILVPLHAYNHFRYKQWLNVYEKGMFLLAYAYKEVHLKWWQTGIFKIFAILLSLVLTALFAPAGMAMQAVMNQIVNMMIGMVVSTVLNALDIPMLSAIISIAMMAYGPGGFDFSRLMNFDAFLKISSTLLQTVHAQSMKAKMEEIKRKQQMLADLEEKNEELEDKIEEDFGLDTLLDITFEIGNYSRNPDRSHIGIETAADFLNGARGEEQYDFESLYDIKSALKERVASKYI